MPSDSLILEEKGGVLVLTINRPEHKNALNIDVLQRLKHAWEEFNRESRLKVAILTGAGSEAFSAGADLKEIARTKGKRKKRPSGIHKGVKVKKPVIAAVNGLAYGGGFELALACDIRVASKNATFALREVTLGFMPGGGGVVRLARVAHPGYALYLLLTGKPVTAQEAYDAGIIDFITDEGKALDKALAIADEIAANELESLIAIKECFYSSIDLSLEEALKKETSEVRKLARRSAFEKHLERFKK